jgi:GAF domain-containing protein
MIANLRETTRNTEQDWLKTNLARFTRMLQGQRDLDRSARCCSRELAPLVAAQQGVFYQMDAETTRRSSRCSRATRTASASTSEQLRSARGWSGQCALERSASC